MDQQQIRVSLSVQTKLLVSLVGILIGVVIFLNISSILLFREDKRSYIYETQSIEALLASKEFVTNSKHAIDTLRTVLATVDPRKGLNSASRGVLQSIVDNQTEILGTALYSMNRNTGVRQLQAEVFNNRRVSELGIKYQDYRVTDEALAQVKSDLLKNSYAFVNVSKMSSTPALAIAVVDPAQVKSQETLQVSIGLLSLGGFGAELKNLKLTIATRAGKVLYDTDPAAMYVNRNVSDISLFKAAIASPVDNGAMEFESEDVHYLGSYVNPGLELVVLTMVEWQRAMKTTYKLIEKFILTGAMAVSAAILYSIFFAKTLTAPLASLYNATREVAGGNFLLQLEEKGRDEFGALSRSFNAMSLKIGELIEERLGQAKFEQELAIASAVQQTLIPPEDIMSERVHIHSHYQSASECGGDWWGYFSVGNKTCLMIADATGHGLSSALITASARSCFSVLHRLAEKDPEFSFSPSNMLGYANGVIYDASKGQIMMTFFIAVLDFDDMTLRYASAGHNPPWLYSQVNEEVVVRSLVAEGRRLGESDVFVPFSEVVLPIQPTDTIVLYTDGLIEGTDASEKQYGKKAARKAIMDSLSGGPTEIVAAMVSDFKNFSGDKKLDDDVTIAVIQILS